MVMIVDDQPASMADQLANALEKEGAEAISVRPSEVSRALVDAADVILVDYRLDDWVHPRDEELDHIDPERQLLADRPRDGLALAAVVRSQLPEDEVRGVALLSANLRELVDGFTPSVTEHAAARVHGLDWAFEKGKVNGVPSLSQRIVTFAEAVCAIRETWPKLDEEHQDRAVAVQRLLDLPSGHEWTAVAARDVHAAQPPINQLATSSHGLSILRWLGQRILPYPTFLVDHRRLAVPFGLTPEALEPHLGTEPFDEVFAALRYEGPLATFLGQRWWRAGIRGLVREWTGSSSPGPEAATRLEEMLGVSLPRLDPPGAVLCIDRALQPWAVPVPREHAVRVRPDDWPPFADTGWMPEELLEDHPELLGLVDPADRSQLEVLE